MKLDHSSLDCKLQKDLHTEDSSMVVTWRSTQWQWMKPDLAIVIIPIQIWANFLDLHAGSSILLDRN